MLSQEIRRKFLKYFKEKGHAVVPSSSVVPHDDPTLLFTNAGMCQFKDLFLGKAERNYQRATTSQKCIRVGGKHNDLDNVGHTTRHLTFFEMLGNFSFGDYFKKDAIQFAWEVSTEIFQLEADKIWVSVFQDDDEAYELWKKIIPEKRIVRLGEKDNFWAMGDTGPCGPCSELLFDRGSSYGEIPSPKEDATGERYLEFWNLVFMQFNRDAKAALTPLPKQSIDTGSGLERVVALKMGVDTVFATDIFQGIIGQIEKVSGKKYHKNDRELSPAFHVIADHIRSLSFAIADGAQPSNIERGYVLRKLLRRAVRYGRMLGMNEPFLNDILPCLVEIMGPDYPELKTAQGRIGEILTLEEEAFQRTLKRGGNILNTVIVDAKSRPEKEISGEEAFKLKDTYGFPLEEVLLIAKDSNLQVDLKAYQSLEEKARALSRTAHVFQSQEVKESIYKDFLAKHPPSTFLGFTTLKEEGEILGIFKEGHLVEQLTAGEEGVIVLNQTPFYAEKGGQVGDSGILTHNSGQFLVTSCTAPYTGIIAHVGKCEKGTLSRHMKVMAEVKSVRRRMIQNNHTATHLLHWALQQNLGPHIRQAGSVVDEERLRFDFSHHKALSKEELNQLEDCVNEKIREDDLVKTYELSYEEVQKKNEIKQFFGDKYGAVVRVVDIDYSKELCGGTHTTRTGTIGYFRIVKEGSIAAGVRRIEAVTGKAAEELCRAKERELEAKIVGMEEDAKKLQQQFKSARRLVVREMAGTLTSKATVVGSTPFLATVAPVASDELLPLAEDLLTKLSSGVVLLATREAEKCQLLLKITPDLVQKGLSAVQMIKEIAPCVGGSGGGKADSAQAGGKTPRGIEEAFEKAKELLSRV